MDLDEWAKQEDALRERSVVAGEQYAQSMTEYANVVREDMAQRVAHNAAVLALYEHQTAVMERIATALETLTANADFAETVRIWTGEE